jgi:hypothetical protein
VEDRRDASRPPVEADLRAAIRSGHGFAIDRFELEDNGADAAAWAWRATTHEGFETSLTTPLSGF